jgi:hypothetical protein
MSRSAYRFIGFVVWRAFRWYLRDRLRPIRRFVVRSFALLAGLLVAAALARRATR